GQATTTGPQTTTGQATTTGPQTTTGQATTTGLATTTGPEVGGRTRLFQEKIIDMAVAQSGEILVMKLNPMSLHAVLFDADFEKLIDFGETDYVRVGTYFEESTSNSIFLASAVRKTYDTLAVSGNYIGSEDLGDPTLAIFDVAILPTEDPGLNIVVFIDVLTSTLEKFDGIGSVTVHSFNTPIYLAARGNLTVVSDSEDNIVIGFYIDRFTHYEVFRHSVDSLIILKDVCIDSEFNVFIAEYTNSRIVRLDNSGKILGLIPVAERPIAVAIKRQGVLLVGDEAGYINTIPY
ncbi:unnamed protein product, partial [Owenia fusiformis]